MKNQSLLLLYDSKIKEGEVNLIAKTLRDVYQINIKEIRAHDTANFAYDKTRNQYDGQKLLNNLIDESKLRFFFWIILLKIFYLRADLRRRAVFFLIVMLELLSG